MENSRDYRRLIQGRRWQKLRRTVLTAHPLCVDCQRQGRLTAATEVHHVVPCQSAPSMQALEALMYDPGNLRPLCHACHLKAHEHLGKGGREERDRRRMAELEAFCSKFTTDANTLQPEEEQEEAEGSKGAGRGIGRGSTGDGGGNRREGGGFLK